MFLCGLITKFFNFIFEISLMNSEIINMKFKSIILFLIIALIPVFAEAQCAMCRAVLESEGSEAAAKGINDGIVYLMVFPYILIGGIAFFVYRTLRNKDSKEKV